MAEKIYLATRDDVLSMGNQIAPIVQSELNDCYDAIELKGGWVPETEEDKNLKNLPQAVESIQDRLTQFIDPGYDSEVTIENERTKDYAFYHMTISKFNAPNVVEIGQYAFGGCNITHSITEEYFNMPNITIIPYACFSSATVADKILDLPNITTVNGSAFNGTKLDTVNLPNCTKLENSAFQSCNVVNFNLPKLTITTINSLYENNMESIELPMLTTIGSNCFATCRNLKTITFGSTPISVGGSIFQNDGQLTSVNFPNSSVDVIFGFSGMRTGLVTTCVITCQDGTIEYIGGSWQIVRD